MAKLEKLSVVCVTLILALAVPLLYIYKLRFETHDPIQFIEDTIRPHSYNITLRPYLLPTDEERLFTYEAETYIEIEAKKDINLIALHSKNLYYSGKELQSLHSGRVSPLIVRQHYPDWSVTIFNLGESLVAGHKYVLHFKFSGVLNTEQVGFFRGSYVDEANATSCFAATQLQPHHAREVFPCFDEPKYKSIFTLTIIRPKVMKSFANTRLLKTTNVRHYAIDEYAPTAPMSTYLVSCVIGYFQERFDGQVGVIARTSAINQTELTLHRAQRMLKIYENYFDLNYYDMFIDKLHILFLPGFRIDGMENWGLIFCKESVCSYQSEFTPLKIKVYSLALLAHELAHMWFGNLVTCASWDNIWLNEGFGRFFEYYGGAMLDESAQLDQQFIVDALHIILLHDSSDTVQPLNNDTKPNNISYKKGAALLRMIQHAMGEDLFRNSLRTYLKEYKYRSTVPDNLLKHWKANWPKKTLSYADGVFSSFTLQVGYPLISVRATNGNKAFTVTQKRFLLNDKDGSNISLRYTIPITYTTDKIKNFASTTPAFYYEASKTEHNVPVDNGFDWVILNIQETGYYRVNYDENNWRAIHRALTANDNWSGIHELNRAQIVDDLLNLARAGEITYDLALEVLEYLSTEIHYLPWTAAFNGYSYLAIRLGEDKQHFSQYILDLTEKSYKHLGFVERSTDSTLDIYNRANVLNWSCKYGNEKCISTVKKYFNNMTTTAVPVNIRSIVYCNAMRFGNETDYDKLLYKYKTETVPTEKTLILNSLGCIRNPKLVQKFFKTILSSDVRRKEKASALSTLYIENAENISPVFYLIRKHFMELSKAMDGYSTLATVILKIASHFTEASQQRKLSRFNTKYCLKFGKAASLLRAAERTVKTNLDWRKQSQFKKYLAKRFPVPSNSNIIF